MNSVVLGKNHVKILLPKLLRLRGGFAEIIKVIKRRPGISNPGSFKSKLNH